MYPTPPLTPGGSHPAPMKSAMIKSTVQATGIQSHFLTQPWARRRVPWMGLVASLNHPKQCWYRSGTSKGNQKEGFSYFETNPTTPEVPQAGWCFLPVTGGVTIGGNAGTPSRIGRKVEAVIHGKCSSVRFFGARPATKLGRYDWRTISAGEKSPPRAKDLLPSFHIRKSLPGLHLITAPQ